jgi:hypothetical protein
MTVSELIELLKIYPQDMQVVYQKFSEQKLIEPNEIQVEELCKPRNDGWVHSKRSDKQSQKYLVFPGN